jgi:acetolactate synthase small subunit
MSADRACPDTATACFAIRAAAEPGILPRLIGLFAKRDLVPAAVQARRIGPGRDLLAVDLQVEGLDPGLAELIAENMRQMVSVERVLLAELPALAERA